MGNEANIKKVAKNMGMVFFSTFATILSGILIGFLVPKLMSLEDYGLYKTYTLYATYIGLFHFGFSDGIYTYFSGQNYNDLNKGEFRKYSRFIIILSCALSILTIIIGVVCFQNEYSIILIFLGVNIFSVHLSLYFQGIVQSVSRFKELSGKNFVQSIINIGAILILYILFKVNVLNNLDYYIYLSVVTFVNYFIAFWYFIKYRELVFGKGCSLGENKTIWVMIKIGFPVLISNLIGTLIMTIDRQFVSVLFDTETYAIYAFAYNMLSLITVAISSVSVVIFPMLKSIDKEKIKENYSFMNSVLLIFVFLALVSFSILKLIVENFISKYTGSLVIFRVIFPGIALTSSITIIMYNVYKAFDKTKLYFFISLGVFILSIIANFIAYYLFKTPISISIASVIVISIWYIITEVIIVIKFKVCPIRNWFYVILMIASFYLITMIRIDWVGLLVYLAAWMLITLVFKFKEMMEIFHLIKIIFKKKT